MKTALTVLFAATVILLAGCATRATAPAASAGQEFRGEVWTWDEPNHTVTLRQGPDTIRVIVGPDQMARLKLHEVMTVHGQLAPPAPIETVLAPAGPTRVVPRGVADVADVTGTIVSVEPSGMLAIRSSQGTLRVWSGAPASSPFHAGDNVRARIQVQPVDRVPIPPTAAAGPPAPDLAASVATEPGDYAAVVGRILAVSPAGLVTVESPRGPIEVWVPNTARYRVGENVEVRTAVHPSS